MTLIAQTLKIYPSVGNQLRIPSPRLVNAPWRTELKYFLVYYLFASRGCSAEMPDINPEESEHLLDLYSRAEAMLVHLD